MIDHFLFKYFSSRVIIDAHPARFVFSRPARDFRISVDTFIYVRKEKEHWIPMSVGEEIPQECLEDPTIYRVDLFDVDHPIQSEKFNQEELIGRFFEYGIGSCFVMSVLPQLRPVVHFLGADRFCDQFENPREIFEKALKLGGAGIVVFDQMDL